MVSCITIEIPSEKIPADELPSTEIPPSKTAASEPTLGARIISYTSYSDITISLDKHPMSECFEEQAASQGRTRTDRTIPSNFKGMALCDLIYPTETLILFLFFEPKSDTQQACKEMQNCREFVLEMTNFTELAYEIELENERTRLKEKPQASIEWDGFYYSNLYVYSEKSLMNGILSDLID